MKEVQQTISDEWICEAVQEKLSKTMDPDELDAIVRPFRSKKTSLATRAAYVVI